MERKCVFEPSGLITNPENPDKRELEFYGHDGGVMVWEEKPERPRNPGVEEIKAESLKSNLETVGA